MLHAVAHKKEQIYVVLNYTSWNTQFKDMKVDAQGLTYYVSKIYMQ